MQMIKIKTILLKSRPFLLVIAGLIYIPYILQYPEKHGGSGSIYGIITILLILASLAITFVLDNDDDIHDKDKKEN